MGGEPPNSRRDKPNKVSLYTGFANLLTADHRPIHGPLITAIFVIVAILMTISLIVGIESRLWRVIVLFLTSLAVAIVVVRLPASWRTRTGLLITAFVATVGVLPILSSTPESTSAPSKPTRQTNVSYLADLIYKGPFTESLPYPLEAEGLKSVNIADASQRVGAAALEMSWPSTYDPFEGFDGPSAHLETYSTQAQAARQAQARFDTLKLQYAEFGPIQGSPESFFVSANREIIAGGVREYVYAEAYSFPDSNANIPLATGTVNAMLRYADKMTQLATS